MDDCEERSTFESIVEMIIDRIVLFTDYFIVKKHVTLSEATLLAFSLSWTFWFMWMGVYVSEMAMSRAMWVSLFAGVSVAHFISFFIGNLLGRAVVVSGYAFMWCFLTFLSLYTGSVAPAVPTLAVFTMLSVFIAVRLFRERQQ